MRRPARSELREHGKMPIQKSNCADFLYQIHILPYLIRLFSAVLPESTRLGDAWVTKRALGPNLLRNSPIGSNPLTLMR